LVDLFEFARKATAVGRLAALDLRRQIILIDR
jgi:hypothetical protein